MLVINNPSKKWNFSPLFMATENALNSVFQRIYRRGFDFFSHLILSNPTETFEKIL